MAAQDEQNQFQSLHPINTRNTWRDTQYHEIRNVLCNIWMTLIFGVGVERLPPSMDSVQALASWENCPSEKLLNILERLHRFVYEKYSAYEGLEMGLHPEFQPLNDLSGLIYEYGEEKEKLSRHGRIRCTCRLRPSAATAAEKKLRMGEIRKLLCFKWAILKKRDRVPGYAEGDGPFRSVVPTRVLNEMLLRLYKILCLSDPPIYVPRVRCRRHIRNYPKPLNFFL